MSVMKRYVNTSRKELTVSAVFMHISGFRQISSQCKAFYHCNWSIRCAHAKFYDSGLPPYVLESSKGLLDIADSKILNICFQVICCLLVENLVLVIF